MHPIGLLCLTPLRLAEIAAHPLPEAPPRVAAAEGRVTCTEPGLLARGQGLPGTFSETLETEHFLVAWRPDNADVTEEALATYTEALENSWRTEVDEQGWRAPDQTDACRITVLLAAFDESWGDTGGYADVTEAGGVPYIVLNTGWLEYGDDWTNTLVAHEFNHASQFAYNVFWDEQDWWYWESTAEWVQDGLYDDANTYIWSLWAYLDTPWRALDSMEGAVQYGHFAFNVHLEEAFDAGTPRAVWDAATADTNVRDAVETATGATFAEVVAGYSSRVAAFDVAERAEWLEALGYFELDPWTHVTALPADGGVDGRGAPHERGQNFLHFRTDTEHGVTFDFNGVPDVEGVPTAWMVTVAEVGAGGAVTHGWVEADAAGAASVTFGADPAVTDVYVAVVPFGEIGERGATYSWSAAAAPAPGTDDTGDTDDTTDTTDGPKEEPEAVACGCATGGDAGAGLGLAGLLLAVGAARRGRPTPGRSS